MCFGVFSAQIVPIEFKPIFLNQKPQDTSLEYQQGGTLAYFNISIFLKDRKWSIAQKDTNNNERSQFVTFTNF